MRLSIAVSLAACCILASCSNPTSKAPAEAEKKPAAAVSRPRDETQRFPMANRVSTEVVESNLMGKDFMPGGTLAHYRKGKTEYEMFVAKTASPVDAASLLPDWRKALADAKLVPSFGGYFGRDGDRPVFVFTRGVWIAGIAGLPEKDADLEARTLAVRLN